MRLGVRENRDYERKRERAGSVFEIREARREERRKIEAHLAVGVVLLVLLDSAEISSSKFLVAVRSRSLDAVHRHPCDWCGWRKKDGSTEEGRGEQRQVVELTRQHSGKINTGVPELIKMVLWKAELL